VKKKLRSGYTTGACAAAAAKGAALMQISQATVSEVCIELPTGTVAAFQLHGQTFSADEASCYVVKDAGDDPDVTNGAEVWATITAGSRDKWQGGPEGQGARDKDPGGPEGQRSRDKDPGGPEGQVARVIIEGGVGIGRVTKPGLAVPPGEWAINPVPRRMIEQSVREVLSSPLSFRPSRVLDPSPLTLKITISIPDGEERARKTLNARLGILGGLSILGTTGIVRPVSAKAWTDTIDAALDVAKACGCPNVVLSTGRSSEMAAESYLRGKRQEARGKEKHPDSILPLDPCPLIQPEAYIMMGDHVAYALQACGKRGFHQPLVACQFAKLLKIACGYTNTHAAASELDLAVLYTWAETAGVPKQHLELIAHANTAREIAVTSGFDRNLMQLVADRAIQAVAGHAPSVEIQPLLCGYDGSVVLITQQSW
jgi:cobalt-precorrin-5B (C1)-methyltransferase